MVSKLKIKINTHLIGPAVLRENVIDSDIINSLVKASFHFSFSSVYRHTF